MEDKTLEQEQAYDAHQIQVLEGLDAVRKRPSMYIGTTSAEGLHHLVWEITDNSIDEALAGHCDRIEVIIEEDGSITVVDNGRGIPVDSYEDTGQSALEGIMTVLHAGGKFGGGGYKVSGGLHGVGAAVVNALSSHLSVSVHRDGKIYELTFKKGIAQSGIEVIGDTDRTGTTVNFLPDAEIFQESVQFDFDILANRLRELAFLNKRLTISLEDKRADSTHEPVEYYYEGGIRSYVEFMNEKKETLHEPIY